jgi:hypothetical protein
MPYFLVLEVNDRETHAPPGVAVRDGQLKTFTSPLAVFHADTAEEACRAAAAATHRLTTYFAIEGTPWGVEMIKVDGVREIGASLSEDDEDEKDRRLRELERRVLDREVPLD